MIENVMRDVGGIGIFGILSVCLFFGFFTGMLLWVSRLKKTYLNSMGGLPLEGEAARHSECNSSSEPTESKSS
jgi:hypothetical protein